MKKTLFSLVLALMLCVFSTACATIQIEIIPWDDLPPTMEGQTHVLLLCVDQWEADPWNLGNTDGIMLVTLDTRAHRVMLTSVIRDALVLRSDRTVGRINEIARIWSPEVLCQVLSEHLGVRIQQYILFDFQQIADLIDELGGVDIRVNSAEIVYLNKYAISRTATDRPLSEEGTYHFNGHAAVIYMRIRKAGGGGDLMRTQRARTVLSSLADQCREFTYDEATALVNSILAHNSMTNMNLTSMMSAMNDAYSLRDCTIEELRIPPDSLIHLSQEEEVFIQEVDWTGCREVFNHYLQSGSLTEP